MQRLRELNHHKVAVENLLASKSKLVTDNLLQFVDWQQEKNKKALKVIVGSVIYLARLGFPLRDIPVERAVFSSYLDLENKYES